MMLNFFSESNTSINTGTEAEEIEPSDTDISKEIIEVDRISAESPSSKEVESLTFVTVILSETFNDTFDCSCLGWSQTNTSEDTIITVDETKSNIAESEPEQEPTGKLVIADAFEPKIGNLIDRLNNAGNFFINF